LSKTDDQRRKEEGRLEIIKAKQNPVRHIEPEDPVAMEYEKTAEKLV
jgi:hypothetical protein